MEKSKEPRKLDKIVEPKRKTEEEAKREINQLIEKQNTDMLKLLED
jgi:hypothetical protein